MTESVLYMLLEISRVPDAAEYLPEIDRADADPDFCCDVSKNSDNIYAVCYDGEVVGLLSFFEDSDAYVYVYIFPKHRKKGYGYLAERRCEEMCSSQCQALFTSYNEANEVAGRLAIKCGFIKQHESVVMTYEGERFDLPPLPIRNHRDEDFIKAYTLSAEAFHVMRLETGHDPNSTPYTPDDEIRQHCLETAHERYVYLLGDEIIGCAHIDGAEIDNVAIQVEHQGRGYGRELVKFLCNEILDKGIGKPFLYCLVCNKKAFGLYKSIGFKETRRHAYVKKELRKD